MKALDNHVYIYFVRNKGFITNNQFRIIKNGNMLEFPQK